MATPSEKLAASLEQLQKHQLETKFAAIRSKDLSRTHRERLIKHGFLKEVIKGWYIPSRPDEIQGESTAWYTSFWGFCSQYFEERFGDNWCLSPEQSLLLHSGNWSVPKQLLVRSPKGRNKITKFPHNTSILDVRHNMPTNIIEKGGLRLFSIENALITCSTNFFTQHTTDAQAILSTIPDASSLLANLLEGGHSTIAGRLAGAFRNIGNNRIAEDITRTMTSAGYNIRELDPFEKPSALIFTKRESSPYINRIRLMWQMMREQVLEHFPKAPKTTIKAKEYLKQIQETYINDAYHSLSIEGYQVTPELIKRVRTGSWNPESNIEDKEQRDALAARGYWQAFQSVENSIKEILAGANAGTIAEKDHSTWYRELFTPSVAAGILRPADLAGYRSNSVYIRQSMFIPPSHEAVRDMMPAFFELLEEETEAAVRIVLGHFLFVYIHPYSDGNGRIGRFLMNTMLASGAYPWTIISIDKREDYITTLEQASTQQNIVPFTKFLGRLMVFKKD